MAVTYKDAGVDIDAGAQAVERIRESVQSTYRDEVVGDIGGFGGCFSAAGLKDMKDPILVSGTDGVGTKIRLAQLMDKHDTVGIDCVAMCANDIVVTGAEPQFFLDYIAIGKMDSERISDIVAGVAEGCRQAGAALIGGEMAEHPGVMDPDDYDVSGFCVGAVDRDKIIDGSRVAAGDVILGLASSGIHSNGFSLVRRVLIENQDDQRAALQATPDKLEGRTLGDALLEPTRIYVAQIRALQKAGVDIKALAHVTGGGITENLNRVLPETLDAQVTRGSWPVPAIIDVVVDAAGLSDEEAYKTFNMGVGFALVVSPDQVDKIREVLNEDVFEIGTIVAGSGQVVYA
ncbi:MAG: phosphoribosylformylglycinamidine cyclo-ligase [Actinomycetia bacterium]|nr:phosphoribosylformylglycinamidine cyclo-ligase [Actinomycetes bacterium]